MTTGKMSEQRDEKLARRGGEGNLRWTSLHGGGGNTFSGFMLSKPEKALACFRP